MTFSLSKVYKIAVVTLVTSVTLAVILAVLYFAQQNKPLGRPEFYAFPDIPPRSVDQVKFFFNRVQTTGGNYDPATDGEIENPLTPVENEPTINESYPQDVADLNQHLLSLCYAYFNVTMSGCKMSPLFPMAVANVETGGRADPNKTFSSLIPSKYVKCDTPADIDNYSVLSLFESEYAYDALTQEWSTNERGSLQENYGYGVKGLNLPSESSIIHQAYPDGNYPEWVEDWWLRGVSTEAGDRFSIEGSVSRLQVSCNQTAGWVDQQYFVDNELQAVAILAIAHGASSAFNPVVRERTVGNWRSGQRAFDYATALSQPEAYGIIRDYAISTYPNRTISRTTAKQLLAEMRNRGLIDDIGTYVHLDGTLAEVSYTYPVCLLYAYTQLGFFYSGR